MSQPVAAAAGGPSSLAAAHHAAVSASLYHHHPAAHHHHHPPIMGWDTVPPMHEDILLDARGQKDCRRSMLESSGAAGLLSPFPHHTSPSPHTGHMVSPLTQLQEAASNLTHHTQRMLPPHGEPFHPSPSLPAQPHATSTPCSTPSTPPSTLLLMPHSTTTSSNKQTSTTSSAQNSGRKYHCKMCPQIFNAKADLQLHTQMHMREAKPYKCGHCPKAFANSSYLSQHMRIHAGLKPYRCDMCDKKFTQLSHLQQHTRTHTGEKPYKCRHPGCTKAFSQLSNLQSHSRCHNSDKPFKCNACYKCFNDECSLLEHIPRHKESKHLKTQICHLCGKSYTQETYLQRHLAKHANTKTGKKNKSASNKNAANKNPANTEQQSNDKNNMVEVNGIQCGEEGSEISVSIKHEGEEYAWPEHQPNKLPSTSPASSSPQQQDNRHHHNNHQHSVASHLVYTAGIHTPASSDIDSIGRENASPHHMMVQQSLYPPAQGNLMHGMSQHQHPSHPPHPSHTSQTVSPTAYDYLPHHTASSGKVSSAFSSLCQPPGPLVGPISTTPRSTYFPYDSMGYGGRPPDKTPQPAMLSTSQFFSLNPFRNYNNYMDHFGMK